MWLYRICLQLTEEPLRRANCSAVHILSVVLSIHCNEQGKNRQKDYDHLIIRHAITSRSFVRN